MKNLLRSTTSLGLSLALAFPHGAFAQEQNLAECGPVGEATEFPCAFDDQTVENAEELRVIAGLSADAEASAEVEAEAEVEIEQLYCTYNIPRIGQIYVLFKAKIKDGIFGAGEESLECRLFEEDEIPWTELAFPSVEQTLKHYFADRKDGLFPAHLETIGTRLDHTG